MNYRDGVFQVKYNNAYEQINFETIASQVKFNHNINGADIETDTQDILDKIIELNLDTQLQLKYGMKGNGTDETELLQKAITENDVVYIPKDFIIGVSKSIYISGNKKIISDGGTIKCLTAGLDDIFKVANSNNVVINGINFNMDKKGMTSIVIAKTDGYLVQNCTFTGFQADTSKMDGNDGGIKIDSSKDGVIAFNKWFNHGEQYGTTTATLNRCIGVAGGCDNTLIIGNTFKNVNQAIVTDSPNIRISNNHFENVKDNSLYLVGNSENIIIEGNTFKNSEDECIVLSGVGGFSIDNNIFNEATNKVIAINSSLTNVSITDNIIKCKTKAPANVIAWRSENSTLKEGTVSNFIVSGNTFEVTPVLTSLLFHFGDIDGGVCTDNYFKFNTTGVTNILPIKFEAKKTLNWVFRNNTLKNMATDASTTNILAFTGTTATTKNFVIENCKIDGRVSKPEWVIARNMKSQFVGANTYLTGIADTNILWSGAKPTDGTWKVGDLVYSTTPAAGGHIGWICTGAGTPGTWSKFGKIE